MKSFIIAISIFACAYAGVVDQTAQVLRSTFDLAPDGGYSWAYETENGISGQAAGTFKASGKDEVALEVAGSYQYESPEGQYIGVSYVADENGYQPQGDHLPTPQPIPKVILRALEYNAAHPEQDTF